jgi:Na+/serine symporter
LTLHKVKCLACFGRFEISDVPGSGLACPYCGRYIDPHPNLRVFLVAYGIVFLVYAVVMGASVGDQAVNRFVGRLTEKPRSWRSPQAGPDEFAEAVVNLLMIGCLFLVSCFLLRAGFRARGRWFHLLAALFVVLALVPLVVLAMLKVGRP